MYKVKSAFAARAFSITLDLPGLVLTVIVLSASGVLSPGPLFVASISRSIKTGGKSGVECAVGHTIVELPLVIGLALGTLTWLQDNRAVRMIGLIGGIVLLFFGLLQVWESKTSKLTVAQDDVTAARQENRSGIVLGIAFTALNPFFIIWWLSVGFELITLAIAVGATVGLGIMYLSHIWMDYAWLGGIGFAASRRRLSFGKWYRFLLAIFGILMIYFGITFIVSSVS